ncbi:MULTISPECIES: hypothetical protein [Flavobacterium]|uniref:Uncharacterized protein n=1 Tax=Flavobacterium anhuiense TaxID=459526 RepID=A0AAC9GIR8_9FLAO|nr:MULTISPECIES: hypothetical protein [Flavobacterium]AOC95895.1 hypothetical protein BB050_02800 [Flavobacterium anhuiense]EJF99774.1 hypothetical protein FF52_19945 [Flavobacterium sp. F52]MXO05313.1 hypothetical protein [Flavobacterium sp. HBTb2-11-1]URM36748.1 hypothetical protein LLY39_20485 [Flavobacterium anhuiense]SCY65415.1 hypothetical protein SAMN02927916_2793 [Flavobacterium anhuiense]
MRSENYMSDEFGLEMNSYEEQLLLNYDDYLEGDYNNRLTASNHYNLELGELEDNLEYDFDSEYDENDWEEEEDLNDNLAGEYDENEEKPGSFEMMN